MTNVFNDPNNFKNVNDPSFPNSYKFGNSNNMANFSRELSHSGGTKNINTSDGKTLNVDFMSDAFRQKANNQYAKYSQ
jgi:hypothetical protein